jgi:hypothetical protein
MLSRYNGNFRSKRRIVLESVLQSAMKKKNVLCAIDKQAVGWGCSKFGNYIVINMLLDQG